MEQSTFFESRAPRPLAARLRPRDLDEFVGQRLSVRANMGRSKIVESEGVLIQVHPQLFIMEVDRKRGRKARQSYQYVDVLTGTVELSQNGEAIFGSFIEEDP